MTKHIWETSNFKREGRSVCGPNHGDIHGSGTQIKRGFGSGTQNFGSEG